MLQAPTEPPSSHLPRQKAGGGRLLAQAHANQLISLSCTGRPPAHFMHSTSRPHSLSSFYPRVVSIAHHLRNDIVRPQGCSLCLSPAPFLASPSRPLATDPPHTNPNPTQLNHPHPIFIHWLASFPCPSPRPPPRPQASLPAGGRATLAPASTRLCCPPAVFMPAALPCPHKAMAISRHPSPPSFI